MQLRLGTTVLALMCMLTGVVGYARGTANGDRQKDRLFNRGAYLAEIGACRACHTPPAVPDNPQSVKPGDAEALRELSLRSDPDWMKYLDSKRELAGGVPFIIRISATQHGIVYSRNITPDSSTGIGAWTEEQIIEVLRTGKRPDGTSLFLFAPHTFYKNLALDDLRALARYLKAQPPVAHTVEARNLPFPVSETPAPPSPLHAPKRGNTAEYLLTGLVGCEECHSSHLADGKVHRFVGGDPNDPSSGVFRLGPDLPLRQDERGFAAFPFPGYAVLYSGNLTRFGKNGDKHNVPSKAIVKAIRDGVATDSDEYGRPDLISYVMLWHFYKTMHYQDAMAIANYIKVLDYEPHDIGPRIRYFGTDWDLGFKQVFGEAPSQQDINAFGKNPHGENISERK